jgi:phosphoenolpyruvate synthase/pyruvate phosphate dikinase
VSCLSLDDPACADVALAGGKGAGLARARQAGLRVPDGFVVPPGGGDIGSAYAELGERSGNLEPVVAVRSSAAWEDGGRASAAGVLESVLGVVGPAAVRAAVQRCAASASSPAATAYRARAGVLGGGVAVVVQLLVPAEISGVAFTAHPLTGDRDLLVVEAAEGLGESVVSGRVAPEHLEVSRASGAVARRLPGRRPVRLDYDPRTGTVVERPVADPTAPVLDDARLAAVLTAALAAEAVVGVPVDVEWALAAGAADVVVLQARPVTALPGSPPPAG